MFSCYQLPEPRLISICPSCCYPSGGDITAFPADSAESRALQFPAMDSRSVWSVKLHSDRPCCWGSAGLGTQVCFSEVWFIWSHTLSRELESCTKSLMLGMDPFQIPNQKGARKKTSERTREQKFIMIQKRGFQPAGKRGEGGIAWNGRALETAPSGLKSPWLVVPYTLQRKLEKWCLPGELWGMWMIWIPAAFCSLLWSKWPQTQLPGRILSVLSNILSSWTTRRPCVLTLSLPHLQGWL